MNTGKTKAQLIEGVAVLHQRIAEVEKSEVDKLQAHRANFAKPTELKGNRLKSQANEDYGMGGPIFNVAIYYLFVCGSARSSMLDKTIALIVRCCESLEPKI